MTKIRFEVSNWIPEASSGQSSLVLGKPSGSATLESSTAGSGEIHRPDLELMREVGRENHEAQARFVKQLLPGIRRVARMLSRTAADADDAVQLVLIELLRSATGYRGEARVENWARRIAVRTIIRHCKRERKTWERIANNPTSIDGDPMTTIKAKESAFMGSIDALGDSLPRHVLDYLNELSDVQRQAIVLHHAFGYSLAEIAEMAKVSPNTIKGRMRLGIATLRRLIRQEQAIGGRK